MPAAIRAPIFNTSLLFTSFSYTLSRKIHPVFHPTSWGPRANFYIIQCILQHTPILTNINRMVIYFKNTKQLTEFMGRLANQVWRPQSQKPSPKSDCRNGPIKALLSLLLHRETTACMAGSPSAASRIRDPADGMQPSSKALPPGEGTCIISLLPSPFSN